MLLEWSEMEERALNFSKEFKDAHYEKGETHTFYDNFFEIFGITRRRVATFEEPIKKLGDKQGFIDLFWKGILLVEQKSTGKDLQKAEEQAYDYLNTMKEYELPQYILLSDFQTFDLINVETKDRHEFELKDLHKNLKLFNFMLGNESQEDFSDLEDVSIKASELIGELYDELVKSKYPIHDTGIFLTQLLFCLFADDTGIWENNLLTEYILKKTNEDGSDLGSKLYELFEVLNTDKDDRSTNINEYLKKFEYINGNLFSTKVTRMPSFNKKMREILLTCCRYDWSKVSPAIFGSLFQAVSSPKKRRELGEHYTSLQNILKVIEPLFLDKFYKKFEDAKYNKQKLLNLQDELSNVKILDPACGCGNFLVVTYRELRRLETQIILRLEELETKNKQLKLSAMFKSKIDVDNFYGIEISEFPCEIARVAMWITDHLANIELSELSVSKNLYRRIPLDKSANIFCENALRINWEKVISAKDLSYIIGNPPFVGAKEIKKGSPQREDMNIACRGIKNNGDLDYVSAWYIKSAQYIQNNTKIKCAFVSTNSITQGQQVNILWKPLQENYHIKIQFAHKTFNWCNEARGKAHVHCIIIGFSHVDTIDTKERYLFVYEDIKGLPTRINVKKISPYLIEYDENILIEKKSKPICNVPNFGIGNKPIDNGNYLFKKEEMLEFIKKEPKSKEYFKEWYGADEFIYRRPRYCLLVKDISPADLKEMPLVQERIKNVKAYRLTRGEETQKIADFPIKFHVENIPNSDYILIPRVTSENREYIPIDIMKKECLSSDANIISGVNDLFLLGILMSRLHMTWVKYVCGKLESRYRYSARIGYNNFPFPKNVTESNKEKVIAKVNTILEIRKKYFDIDERNNYDCLYDSETMPNDLRMAHYELDKAVEACYNKRDINKELDRIVFLFKLYEEYTNDNQKKLISTKKTKK